MNLNDTLVEIARKTNIVKKNDLVGYYDIYSQAIHLPAFTKDSFDKAVANVNYESSRFFSTYLHELSHWLDHNSSIWGLKLLTKVYNALNAYLDNDESKFHHIVTLNRTIYSSQLTNYFTVKESGAYTKWNGEPWIYKPSCGLKFDSNGYPNEAEPIVFTRFFSNPSRKPIIRVPLTTLSLTEAVSSYSESMINYSLLDSLTEDERLVEISLLKQRTLELLYNPEFAIYTTAAHTLSNIIGISDYYIGFEYTSKLSLLVLNFPSKLFESIKIPDNEIFKLWGRRVSSLLHVKDLGHLFFLLAYHAPKFDPHISVDDWLKITVKNAGLPDIDTIKQMGEEEVKNIESELIMGPLTQRAEYLIHIGREIYNKRTFLSPVTLSELSGKSFPIPTIILGDDSIVQVEENTLNPEKYNLPNAIEHAWDFKCFSDSFCSICF